MFNLATKALCITKLEEFHDFKDFFNYPKPFHIFLKLCHSDSFFYCRSCYGWAWQQFQHISLGVTIGNPLSYKSDQFN